MPSQEHAGTDLQEPAASAEDAASDRERVGEHPIDFTRLLYMLYVDLEMQIARADAKAQIILSANALLIAAVANIGFGFVGGVLDSITPASAAAVTALVLMLTSAVVSVYSALRVAFPRLVSSASDDDDLGTGRSMYFSRHIAELSSDEYVARFLGLTLHDVKEQVMLGIHSKAVIVQRKYRDVQRSMIGIMAAVFFWALGRIMTNLL